MKYREKKLRNIYSNRKYNYIIYIHTEYDNIYHIVDKMWCGHYWDHIINPWIYLTDCLPKKIYNNNRYNYLIPKLKFEGGHFKVGDYIKGDGNVGKVIATIPIIQWSNNNVNQNGHVKTISEKTYRKQIERQLLEQL